MSEIDPRFDILTNGVVIVWGYYDGQDVPVIDGKIPTRENFQTYIEALSKFYETHSDQDIEAINAVSAARYESRRANITQAKEYFHAGYVYLVQSPSGAYKIGKTRNPKDRLRTFGVKLPFEIEFIALIKTDDMDTLEADLHLRYDEKCAGGEWFNLSPEDVEYIKSLAVEL